MVPDLKEREERRLLQRRAWDAEHLRTVGTKLPAQDFERLKAHCEDLRMSRYALLQSLILDELNEKIQ